MDLNNVDGIQILDQEVNWHRGGIKEAIHIRIMRSKINWDKGRHHLPLSTTTFFSPVTQNQAGCSTPSHSVGVTKLIFKSSPPLNRMRKVCGYRLKYSRCISYFVVCAVFNSITIGINIISTEYLKLHRSETMFAQIV